MRPDNLAFLAWRAVLPLLAEGDVESATLYAERATQYAPAFIVGQIWEYIDYLSRDYESMRNRRPRLDQWTAAGGEPAEFYLQQGGTYALEGNMERARLYADSAIAIYDVKLEERPDDDAAHMGLAIAYGYMGRKEEAYRHADKSTELMPLSRDAVP